MPLLNPGTTIAVSDGTSLTVVAYIKSGGQGEIYRVIHHPSEKMMALKWYTDPRVYRNSAFKHSLKLNCTLRPPSDAFLWPLALTERHNGTYGYIMKLGKEGYHALGEYFCCDRYPDIYMRSWQAKINAAIQIADAFSSLHRRGYTYQDINDGSFMIHPVTGRVLICDNDNIVQDGMGHGVAGKPHYMAPEVINGAIPSIESDRFSLAIILYRLFAIDHPFEGNNTISTRYACYTPQHERHLFGYGSVFCYDAYDLKNRPSSSLHRNSLFFWPMFTPRLQTAFQKALGQEALRYPHTRLRAREWRSIAMHERAGLVTCHADSNGEPHDFLCQGDMPRVCPLCGNECGPEVFVLFESGIKYRLTPEKALFIGTSVEADGICHLSIERGMQRLMLENTSGTTWRLTTPEGRVFSIEHGATCPLIKGIRITIGQVRMTVV